MTKEQIFENWLKTRPKIIQKMGKKFPVNCLVEIISTGQLATPLAYNEDSLYTMTVFAYPFSKHEPSHNVYGLNEKDFKLIANDYKEYKLTSAKE